MITMRKVTAIFFAFLILMPIFAGCSKDDNDKDATSKTTVSSSKEDESDEKTYEEEKTSSHQSTKAGDIINFGQYEQDNDLSNGKESIKWRVLTVENGKAFLLADRILEAKPYNVEEKDVTWEICTLRAWLNSDFYNTAFAAAEQAKIILSDVVNEDNLEQGTDGGNNTKDRIFLLSYSEAYNPSFGFNTNPSYADPARKAKGSDFAKSKGLLIETDSAHLGNSHWWLRTPGDNQFYNCYVYSVGFINLFGSVNDTNIGVRPALWINL